MQFHTYTQISSHIHAFRHIVGMHTCTRAHDYAHVHAIKIFHTCVQKHMLETKCTRARMSKCTHVCTHTYACSPSLSYPICMFSCHVTLNDLSSSYN